MQLNNNAFDVIIVGAGPGGLTAAKILANNNKKVLLLEKNPIAGNKVCAGGLTVKDFKEMHLSENLIENGFNYINIHASNRSIKLGLDYPWIWTCNRKNLGKWQLDEVKKSGAEIRLDTKVIEIKNDYVLTNNQEKFYFKHLIGADGANSIVRKSLGLKINKILTAIQYIVPKQDFNKNELEIFFNFKRFGVWYAWVFPHKNSSSVGAAIDPRFFKTGELKQNFDTWCKEIGLDPLKYQLQAAPINYDFQGVEFGNIFLIGDAAGLTSGVTGEGMYPAMVSGKEIAQKIINPNHKCKDLKKLIKSKRFEEIAITIYKINKPIAKIIFKICVSLFQTKRLKRKLILFLTEK